MIGSIIWAIVSLLAGTFFVFGAIYDYREGNYGMCAFRCIFVGLNCITFFTHVSALLIL